MSKYKTTSTQNKADRYIRASKKQIRTKAEKRVKSMYDNIVRKLSRRIHYLERKIKELQEK